MAIRMMVSKEKAGRDNVDIVRNFHGHEENRICHSYDCLHRNESEYIMKRGSRYKDTCKPLGPLYMETTHKGLVLEKRERNGYNDSDFYAIVWDEENNKPKEIEYASTREWSYPNGAVVDATDEIREKYNSYITKQREIAQKAREEAEARIPQRGRNVVVVKGRKVPKGTRGNVFWRGVDKYKSTQYGTYYRIGIKDESGNTHWISEDNVEVVRN